MVNNTEIKYAFEAAKVHKSVSKDLKNIVKPGVTLSEIANFIESTTQERIKYDPENPLKGGIGFPPSLSVNEIVSGNLPPYPPNLQDLYRLYQFVILNKRTTILEFGSGWSSLIFSLALSENKRKYSKEIKELRRNTPFELFVLENKKKYLNQSKARIIRFKNKLGQDKFSSKTNWYVWFTKLYC